MTKKTKKEPVLTANMKRAINNYVRVSLNKRDYHYEQMRKYITMVVDADRQIQILNDECEYLQEQITFLEKRLNAKIDKMSGLPKLGTIPNPYVK